MTHPRIGPEEAARLLAHEGYAYLDVRTEKEFALGHPEGAYNIPWQLRDERGVMQINPEFLRVVRARFAPDEKLIVGCRSGNRSLHASLQLTAAGFDHVVEQRAGFAGVKDAFGGFVEEGWERRDLPTGMQAKAGRSYVELRARVERT
jgi:rhodanese-related sulfurtransferase